MLSEEIILAIEGSVLCWLASASPRGVPNVSPKELWTHVDQSIVVANIASPQTLKNIRSNAAVCLSFVNVFDQRGYQIHGLAEVITNKEADFDKWTSRLKRMAGLKFPFSQAFKIAPQSVKEILAPSYLLYPEETSLASQREAAYNRYGVRPIKASTDDLSS